MGGNWLVYLALLVVLGFAIASDLATRRIPNKTIIIGLFSSLACSSLSALDLISPELDLGFGMALAGAMTGLACLLPLYFFNVMGAGDAKLMAVVGAFLGPWQTVGAVLLTFAAGGVLSLSAGMASRSLGQVWNNLRLMLLVALQPRSSGLTLADVKTTGRLPYALAIGIGTALQLWLAARGGWAFA